MRERLVSMSAPHGCSTGRVGDGWRIASVSWRGRTVRVGLLIVSGRGYAAS